MPDKGLQQRKPPNRRSSSKRPNKSAPVARAPSNPNSHGEQGKRLIQVLGKKLVRRLAISSASVGILLSLIVFISPTLIASQTARGVFCLLIAFCFSVFGFTFYPSDYKLNISPKIGIPMVLVGPAALWIGLFFAFLNLLPREAVMGTMFLPSTGSNQVKFSSSWVLGWDPVQPNYYKVKISDDQNSNDSSLPAGFYVTFDQGHNRYTAKIGLGPSRQEIFERYEVVFVRGASTYQAKLVSDGGENR